MERATSPRVTCVLSLKSKTCRTKSWVSSPLVTRGSHYPTAWHQPPASSSWSPCHNSSQRPAREDCTTRPWSVFSTAQPANPSFFPAQLFSISAQEACPVFDSWVLLYEAIMGRLSGWNGSQSGCGITLDSEANTEQRGALPRLRWAWGQHTDRLLTQAWRQGFLSLGHRVWTPPSLFLSCLPATAFSLLDPRFGNNGWVPGWWCHFFLHLTHAELDRGSCVFLGHQPRVTRLTSCQPVPLQASWLTVSRHTAAACSPAVTDT